jgi:hypothetical protein
MKKTIVFHLAGCMLTTTILAQSDKPSANTAQPSKGTSNKISLGISFPIEAFNRSHSTVIALEYLRSQNRYGQDTVKHSSLKFAINGGIS